jgi:hypothetical protein
MELPEKARFAPGFSLFSAQELFPKRNKIDASSDSHHGSVEEILRMTSVRPLLPII